jgi:hypothetical protein
MALHGGKPMSSCGENSRTIFGCHRESGAIKEAPQGYAEYLLHETAVNIVLLVESFEAL